VFGPFIGAYPWMKTRVGGVAAEASCEPPESQRPKGLWQRAADA